jgi:hypothetical protein
MKEESLAPMIEDRLSAAAEIQKAGYRLGFHFDPLIGYDYLCDFPTPPLPYGTRSILESDNRVVDYEKKLKRRKK